ncbi:MAG: hydrogenase iron-sulfur subunit, partial [Candidatus Latescibacterota bacterium]
MKMFEPQMVVYCCQNSVDEQGTAALGRQFGASMRMVRLPCGGKTDVRYLLKTFESGADGVLVIGCPEGECRSLDGNRRAEKRVGYVQSLLEEIGFGGDRMAMAHLSPCAPESLGVVVAAMIEKIEALGPNPAKKVRKEAGAPD